MYRNRTKKPKTFPENLAPVYNLIQYFIGLGYTLVLKYNALNFLFLGKFIQKSESCFDMPGNFFSCIESAYLNLHKKKRSCTPVVSLIPGILPTFFLAFHLFFIHNYHYVYKLRKRINIHESLVNVNESTCSESTKNILPS